MPLSRVPDFKAGEAARGSCTFRVHDVTPRQSLAVLMNSGTRMRMDLMLQNESWACQYGPLGLGGRKLALSKVGSEEVQDGALDFGLVPINLKVSAARGGERARQVSAGVCNSVGASTMSLGRCG